MDLKGYTLGARNGVLAFRPQARSRSITSGTRGNARRGLLRLHHRRSDRHAARARARLLGKDRPDCRSAINRTIAAGAVGPASDADPSAACPRTDSSSAASTARTRSRPKSSTSGCRAAARHRAQASLWLYESQRNKARRNLTHEKSSAGGIGTPRALSGGEQLPQDAALGGGCSWPTLVLDTRPVCAHTTRPVTALWAGRPGAHLSGRIPSCPGWPPACCRRPKLPELIAADLAEYESIAARNSRTDRQRLDALKRFAAGRTTSASVRCSTGVRYTRGDLEELFRGAMARSACLRGSGAGSTWERWPIMDGEARCARNPSRRHTRRRPDRAAVR